MILKVEAAINPPILKNSSTSISIITCDQDLVALTIYTTISTANRTYSKSIVSLLNTKTPNRAKTKNNTGNHLTLTLMSIASLTTRYFD